MGQAWFNAFALDCVLRVVRPMVERTFLPVLRLVSGDPARIDRDYEALVAQRAAHARTVSQSVRWENTLASFVGELEWVCSELRYHMEGEQYEALVTGTVARELERRLAPWLPRLARVLGGGVTPVRGDTLGTRLVEHWAGSRAGLVLLRRLGPLGCLVGPIRLQSWSRELAHALFEVERCTLRAPREGGHEAQETCRRVCRGAVEAVCGPGAPVELRLRPLSSGACEVQMRWRTPALLTAAEQGPRDFVPEEALLGRRRGRDIRLWN